MKSTVWCYFAKSQDKQYAMCKACGAHVMRSFSSTTGLRRHLEKNHKELYSELESIDADRAAKRANLMARTDSQKLATMMLEDIFQKPHAWPDDYPKSLEIDRKVLEMIINDNEPFEVVTRPGFRRLVSCLEPMYNVKPEWFYRELLTPFYEEAAASLRAVLPENCRLALTVDLWSVSDQTESLLSLTAHYVDVDLCRQRFVLAAVPIAADFTGEDMSILVWQRAAAWRLDGRIEAVICDGGTSSRKTLGLLEVPNAECACHLLHLSVKASLAAVPEAKAVVKKVKVLLAKLAASPTYQARLTDMQKSLLLPQQKPLQTVGPPWNANFYRLCWYNEQHAAVAAVLCSDEKSAVGDCLTPEELALSRSLVELLQPIEEATRQFCLPGEAVSAVIPVITMLLSRLETLSVSLVSRLQNELIANIRERFRHLLTCDFFALATALDNRFKLAYFTANADTFPASSVRESLLQKLTTVASEMELQVKPELDADQPLLLPALPTSTSFLQRLHAERLSALSSVVNLSSRQRKIESDLDNFFTAQVSPMSEEPLQHWRANAHKYSPALLKLARTYLCAPAACLPNDRLFAQTTGRFIPRRHDLMSEGVDKLLFLTANFPLVNHQL